MAPPKDQWQKAPAIASAINTIPAIDVKLPKNAPTLAPTMVSQQGLWPTTTAVVTVTQIGRAVIVSTRNHARTTAHMEVCVAIW